MCAYFYTWKYVEADLSRIVEIFTHKRVVNSNTNCANFFDKSSKILAKQNADFLEMKKKNMNKTRRNRENKNFFFDSILTVDEKEKKRQGSFSMKRLICINTDTFREWQISDVNVSVNTWSDIYMFICIYIDKAQDALVGFYRKIDQQRSQNYSSRWMQIQRYISSACSFLCGEYFALCVTYIRARTFYPIFLLHRKEVRRRRRVSIDEGTLAKYTTVVRIKKKQENIFV